MPNWCENDLTVTGPKEAVLRFKELAKGKKHGEDTVLSEENFIPYPEDFRILDEASPFLGEHKELPDDVRRRLEAKGLDVTRDGYNQGGYEWCIENWGTKWGFCDPKLVGEYDYGDGKYCLQYSFDTAWSPPIPLVKKMGEMFPELEFDLRYFEGGCGFNGILRIEGGEVVIDRCAEYFGYRGG